CTRRVIAACAVLREGGSWREKICFVVFLTQSKTKNMGEKGGRVLTKIKLKVSITLTSGKIVNFDSQLSRCRFPNFQ
ncbi:MAG: hypothetical protein K1V88_01020, partial [Muribaculaceae bacterium]